MSLSLPRLRSTGIAIAAMACTSLTFGAALSPVPAQARASGPFYTAQLAQPAADTRTVAGGVLWQCDGHSCVADKGTSRPVVMCARLARAVGPVEAFSADGKALEAKDLDRCNGK